MEDVRLYIRDALREYARLQTFAPRPSWDAVCYHGPLLLEQFGFPYPEDGEVRCRPRACPGITDSPCRPVAAVQLCWQNAAEASGWQLRRTDPRPPSPCARPACVLRSPAEPVLRR